MLTSCSNYFLLCLCYEGGERVDVTARIWRCDVGYVCVAETDARRQREEAAVQGEEGVILIHTDQGPQLGLGIPAVRPDVTHISVSVVR